jgi:hypothetical protein
MSTLTSVQHTSALVFGSFLLVHLAAPSVAVVARPGGSLDLATKTMVSMQISGRKDTNTYIYIINRSLDGCTTKTF